jgi:hypothetical protein
MRQSDLPAKPSMSQSEEPKPPARQKTPRVPSNVFYDRILPIVLVVVAIVLVIIIVVVILGAGQTY